ncbi:MAG: sugar ABC transporter permease [Defluviitaleaceae bacterium]|nr:sugar ABC transporter permease [Defluviitaleaceae bacterium]MCL2263293.1 sugar ABC transporter permease [Defluviitaleaceae bacterium]
MMIKKSRQSYMLMLPYYILFFTFTILPVLTAIVFSFTNFNMLQAPSFVGWTNYTRLFLENEIFVIALQNTLIFAVVTGPLSFFLCFVFAWIINDMPPKIRAFMTLVFYAPSISGNVFFMWQVFFSGDRMGHVNGFLINLGLIDSPINFFRDARFIMPILIIVQLWMSLGVGFLAFIAGLQTVDKALFEAGAVDGIRNRWQELWFITLPSMKPQLLFAAVMQITTSFAIADIVTILAGLPTVNYAGDTIVTHLQDIGWIRFEMGYASAVATILFLLMVGTNKGVQRILRKVGT